MHISVVVRICRCDVADIGCLSWARSVVVPRAGGRAVGVLHLAIVTLRRGGFVVAGGVVVIARRSGEGGGAHVVAHALIVAAGGLSEGVEAWRLTSRARLGQNACSTSDNSDGVGLKRSMAKLPPCRLPAARARASQTTWGRRATPLGLSARSRQVLPSGTANQSLHSPKQATRSPCRWGASYQRPDNKQAS